VAPRGLRAWRDKVDGIVKESPFEAPAESASVEPRTQASNQEIVRDIPAGGPVPPDLIGRGVTCRSEPGHGKTSADGSAGGGAPAWPTCRSWWRWLHRQRRWLFGSLLAAELGVALAIATLPPVYRAHMSLELTTPPGPGLSSPLLPTGPDTTEARETMARQLQSRSLLDEVATGLALSRRREFTGADSAAQLLRHLEVDPVRDTRVVELRFSASDPALAEAVLVQLAARYQQATRRRAAQDATAAADRLAPELQQAHRRLWTAQQAQSELATRRGVDCGDAKLAAPRARLEQVEQARTQATIDLDRTTAAALEPEAVTPDLALPEMETRGAELRSETRRLATQYGSEAPILVRARAALASVAASLAAHRLELSMRRQAERRVQEALVAELQSASGRQRQELNAATRAAAACSGWTQQAEVARQLGATLLRQQSDLRVLAQTAAPSVRVLEPAQAPLRPERPRPLADLALGGLLGLGFGAYLAWWHDVHDPRFWLESCARESWPVLARLPNSLEPEDPGTCARQERAWRHTAAQLHVAGRLARRNILVLTPLVASLDAPMLVLALARAMAELSDSVVLVTAARKDSAGTANPEARMVADALTPNLRHLPILSAEPFSGVPVHLLRQWLLQLQQCFEWVLLDLPGLDQATPLLDAQVATGLLVPDGGVLRAAVRHGLATLAALETPCLGLLVHGATPGNHQTDMPVRERSMARHACA